MLLMMLMLAVPMVLVVLMVVLCGLTVEGRWGRAPAAWCH